MMENENNFTQFIGRRGELSEQEVQAFGRNYARSVEDIASVAEPHKEDANSSTFAPLDGILNREVTQKKKLPRFALPAIIAAAVLIVAVISIVLLTRKPSVDTAQLLESGIAYLDDEQYLEALEQFRTVIDADPEASEAPYIGAADAYIGLNRNDRAIRILEKGYRNTDSSIIQSRLDELIETLAAAENADGYGNTNGNLSNGALAAVEGEWFYFTVDDAIYKAKADGTEKILLTDEAYYINVEGDWVYFIKNNNIHKIKTDGTEKQLISEDFIHANSIAVAGDWIYYGTTQSYEGYEEQAAAESISMATGEYGIYKIRTDGSERTQVTPTVCRGLNIDGDTLYYFDIDFCLWKIGTDGSAETQLLDELCYSFNVAGDWIYYISFEDHGIYKMRTSGRNNTQISGDYTTYLNVSGDWLYYSNFSFTDDMLKPDTGIYKMRLDGSEKTQLKNVRAFIPNVAGDWIYYMSYGEEYETYYKRIRTDGTDEQSLN